MIRDAVRLLLGALLLVALLATLLAWPRVPSTPQAAPVPPDAAASSAYAIWLQQRGPEGATPTPFAASQPQEPPRSAPQPQPRAIQTAPNHWRWSSTPQGQS